MSERATFHMTRSIEQQTLDVLLRIEALLLSRQAMTYAPVLNPVSSALANTPGVATLVKPKGKHK